MKQILLVNVNRLCASPEPEWVHVGSLEVTMGRSWLLFQNHVAHTYLDLFHKRGQTRPPENMGRVNVLEVQKIMWPPWIRAFSAPAFKDTGRCRCTADVDPMLASFSNSCAFSNSSPAKAGSHSEAGGTC